MEGENKAIDKSITGELSSMNKYSKQKVKTHKARLTAKKEVRWSIFKIQRSSCSYIVTRIFKFEDFLILKAVFWSRDEIQN